MNRADDVAAGVVLILTVLIYIALAPDRWIRSRRQTQN